jgi:hypothetical protein
MPLDLPLPIPTIREPPHKRVPANELQNPVKSTLDSRIIQQAIEPNDYERQTHACS